MTLILIIEEMRIIMMMFRKGIMMMMVMMMIFISCLPRFFHRFLVSFDDNEDIFLAVMACVCVEIIFLL